MGPNSFRNLTYAAVLAVVGALVYLVYQSSKKKQRLNPSVESSSTLGAYTDTLGSIAGTSSAALVGDSVRSSVDGSLLSRSSSEPSSYSSSSPASSSVSDARSTTPEVKEVVVEDDAISKISSTDDGISSSQKKVTVTSKGVKSPAASKAAPAKVKFDDGAAAGDYMVVAGSFASKDNAEALVAKLKKIGFSHAEAVKMENSANTYTVAGYYKFKGGAEAAVRTLKANKVAAIVKKKSGDIYKAAPAPVKPVATPKSAPVKATAKPI